MEDALTFTYKFKFAEKPELQFLIQLDREALDFIPGDQRSTADWALLENNKCPNCTLNSDSSIFCPIALNLVDILPKFKNVYSYENASVSVKSEQRSYSSETTVQHGLGSMFGIYMVTSGCPVMSKLKPMVRYHLPFATIEETVYRSASTYLLGQYFKHKRGETGDWDLEKLIQIYREIQEVNIFMADRLRTIPAKDANVNALIVLDVFAKELPHSIEESLKRLEYLFGDID